MINIVDLLPCIALSPAKAEMLPEGFWKLIKEDTMATGKNFSHKWHFICLRVPVSQSCSQNVASQEQWLGPPPGGELKREFLGWGVFVSSQLSTLGTKKL